MTVTSSLSFTLSHTQVYNDNGTNEDGGDGEDGNGDGEGVMVVTVAAGVVECQLGAMINAETSMALSPYSFPSLLGWCCYCSIAQA